MEMRFPYLVQRIKERKNLEPRHKGIDRYFGMDYMGAAEFEFGAIPHTLSLIRNTWGSAAWKPKRIKEATMGAVMWYVGPEDQYDIAKAFVLDQLTNQQGGTAHLKESTMMYEAFIALNEYYRDIIGWMPVTQKHERDGDGHRWAVFTKKEHAENWLRGLAGAQS